MPPENMAGDIAEGVKGKDREGKTGSSNKNSEGTLKEADKELKDQGGRTTPTTQPKGN